MVTPSPRGEVARGMDPLNPLLLFSHYSNTSLSLYGDAIAARVCEHELKERQEKPDDLQSPCLASGSLLKINYSEVIRVVLHVP